MKLSLITVALCLALNATAQEDNQLQMVVRQLVQLQKVQEERHREYSNRFNAVNKQLDVAVQQRDEMKEQLEAVNEDRRQLRKQLESNSNTGDMELRITHLEGSVSMLGEAQMLVESRLVLTQSSIENMQVKINDIDYDMKSVVERVWKLETGDKNGTRLDKIESRLTTQESIDDTHDKLIEDAHVKLQLLEVEAQNTSQEVRQLTDQVQDLESTGDVAERYSFLADITTNLDTGCDVIVFDRVRYDNDGVYNNMTGVWTAPINGTYTFTVTVWVTGSKAYIDWHVDSVETAHSSTMDTYAGDYSQKVNTLQLQLSVGQQVTVKMYKAGCIHGNTDGVLQSYISGHLIEV